MKQPESRKSFIFNRPGKYRIRVHGFLDKRWSERLGGLRIAASSFKGIESVTSLVGEMRDQAELAGVLDTLFELHLSLLSVEYLNGD
jgi:hypothetical protein